MNFSADVGSGLGKGAGGGRETIAFVFNHSASVRAKVGLRLVRFVHCNGPDDGGLCRLREGPWVASRRRSGLVACRC